MNQRHLFLSAIGLALSSTMPACSCSSSSTPPAEPAQDSGTPDSASAVDSASGALTVTPATGNVLTCETLQLTATGDGSASGTWSVSPTTSAGAVSTAGLYAAPNVAPTNPAVSVTFTAGSASASAALNVATAFVGSENSVPITPSTESNSVNLPFEHQFAANGAHVYVGLVAAATSGSDTALEADFFASTDNGKTFTGPTSYHTGDLTCATIAVDAGDPETVYLAYFAGHGDSTSNTGATLRLAVSTDGAKTFPVEYVLADSVNSLASFICPDVTSPSAGHVIVAANAQDDDGHAHIATYTSGNKGANIGPIGTEGIAVDSGSDFFASSDTNAGNTASLTSCGINSDGSAGSPRVFANANGAACIAYTHASYAQCVDPNGIMIQCSTDNGSTWSTPYLLGVLAGDTFSYPTGSISPKGTIAVTWLSTEPDDAGSTITTYVAFSTDGGTTFTTTTYPADTVAAMGGTELPVVTWENDDILWISQTSTGNTPLVYVDKTCDQGASWSGAVVVDPAGNFNGGSLILTSAGMVATGDTHPNVTGGPAIDTFFLNAP